MPASRVTAVCPGSYDPLTLGHVDVIARAANMFDEVVAAVVHNPAKQGLFDPAERSAMLSDVLHASPATAGVRVDVLDDGLLVDYCRSIGATVVLKGLRGGTDVTYEMPMARMNRHLTGLETVFLPGSAKFEHVSSSLVKEVAAHGGDVRDLVPARVHEALMARLGR